MRFDQPFPAWRSALVEIHPGVSVAQHSADIRGLQAVIVDMADAETKLVSTPFSFVLRLDDRSQAFYRRTGVGGI
jgi:hypothetical protein